ncbi:hypothetical protein MPSEU_000017200 [Mayamaea pseudoterrestris]|nr:hypothetical protein MPSEU_000017200 [Mayamaea pseudoterrestris]
MKDRRINNRQLVPLHSVIVAPLLSHLTTKKMSRLALLLLALLSACASASQGPRLFGVTKLRGGDDGDEQQQHASSSDSQDASNSNVVEATRGGSFEPSSSSSGNEDDYYVAQLEQIKAQAMESARTEIDNLRKTIIDQGTVVEDLGQRSDTICNQALQAFAQSAPDAANDVNRAVLYDRKLRELEAAVDAPLQVLYLRQLAYLREAALQRFRASTKTTGVSDYEAMLQADSQFVSQAEQSTRPSNADWDYSSERTFLQAVMNNFAETSRKVQDAAITASQQQQTAMQFLQSQQQMIQQLQMQLYGQSSPWNVGVAYRIPDTNFNLQGSYQQGRANVQLSCVPDEYAPFLGPNGFTNGVGPGNLGLSVNLSV